MASCLQACLLACLLAHCWQCTAALPAFGQFISTDGGQGLSRRVLSTVDGDAELANPVSGLWERLAGWAWGAAGSRRPLRIGRHDRTLCEDTDWRKRALKLVREIPFAGLFADLQNQTKFEASGIAEVDGKFYVVFDSLRALGYVDDQFQFRAPGNRLIGEIGEESQWEGITYRRDKGNFIVVQETHEHAGSFHPLAEEIRLNKDHNGYDVVEQCRVDYNLSSANKGLEAIHFHDGGDKGKFLLGLCEGNHCEGGRRGRDSGHGRIVVTSQHGDSKDSCRWTVDKVIHVPRGADFDDYSGMAFYGNRVGIVSQENSALWVGTFDWDAMEFADDEGEVFHFPRDNNCEQIYCNIEGIQWLDEARIIVTSDRAKADQPFVCVPKDQSIHVFVLPAGALKHS